jgi:UDP-2,4-diacetamido-2,4,6-trideoxy-beta-L-altropyranose hydrolase
MRIFFRADGNEKIGLGHIVRCLALAEILGDNYHCNFLIKAPSDKIKEMIRPYAHVFELPENFSLENEINILSQYLTSEDALVIDHYSLGSNYQQAAKKKVKKLVAIDDEALFHFYSDLILNHAFTDMAAKYDKESYTQVLAGPEYLIVRKPFRNAALQNRTISSLGSIFICMGGADPYNITCKVIDAVISLPFMHIVVVTGGAYQHEEALNLRVKDTRVKWTSNLSAVEMITHIEKCELAVCTASSISFEICCVKSGLLIGIVEDNQQNIYQCLLDQGCALGIGDFRTVGVESISLHLKSLMNPIIINRQIQQQRLLIDGKSGERILEKFNAIVN